MNGGLEPKVAPPKLMIDEAVASLKNADGKDPIRLAQSQELHQFGDSGARDCGASGLTPEFILGYTLGIETARIMLVQRPDAIQAGVEL